MKNLFMLQRLLGVFIGSLLAFSAGCTGTSVGNPPGAQVQLSVVGTADEVTKGAPQTGINPLGGGVIVDKAWISLGHFQLDSADQCGMGGSPDVPEIFAVDLLENQMLPSLPVWERKPDASYCALNANIQPLEQPIASLPEALLAAPVYLEGTRSDGVPFRISIPMDEPLTLTPIGKNDFELEDVFDALLIEFNLNTWINPGELGQANVKNGWIIADGVENAGMVGNMRARIGASARLLRDKDKNGKVDDDDSEL